MLVVKGRVDHKEGETKLIAIEVSPFEAVPERKAVHLKLDARTAQAGIIRELAGILRSYPGEASVYVAMTTSEGRAHARVRARLPREAGLRPLRRGQGPARARRGRLGLKVRLMDARAEVVARTIEAINDHDLDAMLENFKPDYRSEQPVHPARAFQGADQVRKNWGALLEAVPDLHWEVLRLISDDSTAWIEARLTGTKADGSKLDEVGVIIFGVSGGAHRLGAPLPRGRGDGERRHRRHRPPHGGPIGGWNSAPQRHRLEPPLLGGASCTHESRSSTIRV